MKYPSARGLMRSGLGTRGLLRRWPRLGLARVQGESMLPTVRPGDRLLVRYDATRVSPGSLVIARFADGTIAVKRAAERRTTASGEPGWWLLSDNPGSGVDSRHRGAVGDSSVQARVLAQVWPHVRRL